jgi:quinol-cytochrome oxidoreductase complex cytochrome b subunit
MNNGKKEFYPDYLIEICIVIFIAIELAVVLGLIYPQDIGRQINFSTPYRPLPEWYFLWLYQIVRYFPGRWAFIGTILLPLIAVLILIFIPYIDRGERGRLKATLAALALLLSFLIFTIIPYFNP